MRENYTTAWSDESVRFISSPSTFATTNLYYVQEIGHFFTLPGYFTEREGLDSYLIVYIRKGKGKLTYQGHTYALEVGQLFFIHCFPYHHYTSDPQVPLELLWVHVYGSSTAAYYEKYEAVHEPVISLASEDIPELILRTLHFQQQKSFATELLTSKILVELLTTILLSSQETDLSDSDKPAYIQAIRHSLEQRFAESLSLEQLAQEHAVSKYYMAKQFKQFTGFTPHEYLIGIRMSHAKERLKYSDMPVSDIAAAVGIHNVSHFINLFRDRTGDTPLVYRKKWQQPR